jgi:glycosyltransferase involved in cell wall biosynthesis
MISVVLLNYNHGKLLPRAVSALMAQTPPPREVIIINDASTDNSLAVIAKLQVQHPSIKLIDNEKNKGAVAGMNEGLKASSQELVYFAAADDYVLPGFFAAATGALEQYPQAAFFCGRVVLVDPQGKLLGFRPFMQPLRRSGLVTPATARAKFALSDNWSVGPGVIYRRGRLMEARGFDENMAAFSDGIIVRRLAFESGFYFDRSVVCAWERYAESLSSRSALSTKESARLIGTACAEVKTAFPRDIRDSYAGLLDRRLRFNMARLWLVFDKNKIEADGMADVLRFRGFTRAVLKICALLPFARLAVMAWMALVLRPYGVTAVISGWYRAKKASLIEARGVANAVTEARSR